MLLVWWLVGRALTYDKLGRYTDALEDFNLAIQADGNNAVYYHNRGYCLRNMNRLTEAIDDYTVALRLDPSYVVALNNRGWVRAIPLGLGLGLGLGFSAMLYKRLPGLPPPPLFCPRALNGTHFLVSVYDDKRQLRMEENGLL